MLKSSLVCAEEVEGELIEGGAGAAPGGDRRPGHCGTVEKQQLYLLKKFLEVLSWMHIALRCSWNFGQLLGYSTRVPLGCQEGKKESKLLALTPFFYGFVR